MKYLKEARAYTLSQISLLLQFFFQRDDKYFYGRYFGTDHLFVLIVKNLLRPNRIIKKLIYRQIVPIPFALCVATKAKELPELPDEWKFYLETLKSDGIVFIPGFFKERSKLINQRYKLNKQEFPASSHYYRFSGDLGDVDLLSIVVEPMMLAMLSEYYGCQPYYRQLPGINVTHSGDEQVGYNDFWHYDTVNQMTAHILLSDTTDSDSCMLYAKGSHRTHRQYISTNDYYYSEKYMNDHFKIIPCVGESGTLIIFDPNGLHRADLKANTFRSHFHLNLVPGNDLFKGEQYLDTASFRDVLCKLKCYQEKSLSKLM